MNKEFDCVEMKNKGAEILRKKLAGLNIAEELKFWQERNRMLKEEQKKIIKKRKRVKKV
jgi:hypothetical protein